jgi:hypothetical protein
MNAFRFIPSVKPLTAGASATVHCPKADPAKTKPNIAAGTTRQFPLIFIESTPKNLPQTRFFATAHSNTGTQ